MEIVFEERRHIAGRYSAHVCAYWSKCHRWLVLEADAYDRDTDDDGPEWLPRRTQPVLTRAVDRFAAIRQAVDDANIWYIRVRCAVVENAQHHEEGVAP